MTLCTDPLHSRSHYMSPKGWKMRFDDSGHVKGQVMTLAALARLERIQAGHLLGLA